jgi:uncharacterized protein with HEPN domain
MPREYTAFLNDILEAISRVETYTEGTTLDEFSGNQMMQDAVVRNLEIIGEAVKRLPDALRKKYPDIEWKKIAGLRDILAHAYFGIDIDIIWDVIHNKLPDFRDQIMLIHEKIQKEKRTEK